MECMDPAFPNRNPDDILRRIKLDEENPKKTMGKLKIFFGYAAGVGKTYAMLEAAHVAKEKGFDVVAGYIEPHQRPATSALVEGLECIPVLQVAHRGIVQREFDLDATLKRKPQIALVDELAHTNADGCRHRKRYQDVEELLHAGINVYTTMNVQHLESLNDKVSSITHVPVFERVPDSIFDKAASVELIDIEPDDLIDRLNSGQVYQGGQAKKALSNFFTKKNLAALREIALRRTADRLNRNPDAAGIGVGEALPDTGESVLALVSDRPGDARVVRTAANMAQAYHGDFVAVAVEPVTKSTVLDADRDRMAGLKRNTDLAEQLGATVVTLHGNDPLLQVAQYAPTAGIGRVLIGSSFAHRRVWPFGESGVDRLSRLAPEISVTVVPDADTVRKVGRRGNPLLEFSMRDIGLAALSVAAATIVSFLVFSGGASDPVAALVYLLAIIILARFGQTITYGVAAAALGTVSYNYFFTYPRLTLFAFGPNYPVIFACLAIGSLLISFLTVRLTSQNELLSRRTFRTEVLVGTSKRLRAARSTQECLDVAARQIVKIMNRPVIMFRVGEDGHALDPRVHDAPGTTGYDGPATDLAGERERAVADWVAVNDERAGATTNTLTESTCLYLPVHGDDGVWGVCGIPVQDSDDFGAFEKNLAMAILEETGQTIERIKLFQERQAMRVKAETESLRSKLLRSVSHDLRTPLTGISGNASVLLESGDELDDEARRRLLLDIRDDAEWLARLVENLLAVTRVEEGKLAFDIQDEVLSDCIDEAVHFEEKHSAGHAIRVVESEELLVAKMDARLVVQVLVNLIANAVNYSPAGTTVTVSSKRNGSFVEVEVADEGPGVRDDEKPRIFEMFYNGSAVRGDHRRGLGLGLSLCKSVVEALGGQIGVRDAKPHGCIIWFTLPAVDAAALIGGGAEPAHGHVVAGEGVDEGAAQRDLTGSIGLAKAVLAKSAEALESAQGEDGFDAGDPAESRQGEGAGMESAHADGGSVQAAGASAPAGIDKEGSQ